MQQNLNPEASVTLAQFGRAVPNDWPLKVAFKFMIAGKARDYWYVNNKGHSPVFITEAAATKVIAKLYREFGHLVTKGQCQYAFRSQRKHSEEIAHEFQSAVDHDILEGRARIENGNLIIAGMGSAQLNL